MRLQLALDMLKLSDAINLVKEVENYIDIIEVGTTLIIKEGLRSVWEIKNQFPHKNILADLKIMDAGEYETFEAIRSGADIVTVLGASDDETILKSLHVAKKENKCIMVDLINIKNIEKRAKEVESLGADYVCVHTGADLQSLGITPFRELRMAKNAVSKSKVAVAGGITDKSAQDFIKENPDILIVGGGLTRQKNKIATAKKIKLLIEEEG